jgi:putative copper resistance protein D
MLEPAVIVLRLLQYTAGSVLMGSALFAVYALPLRGPGSAAESRWPRPLLMAAAAVLAVAAALGLAAQTVVLAGSVGAGLTAEALSAVVGGMSLGMAALVRVLAAAAAFVVLLLARPGRAPWVPVALLGATAVASFGWMGHGVATEGVTGGYHLAADIVHALTAAVWVGALVAFVFLLRERTDLATLHGALRRFSRLGVPLVAALLLSGLVNAWFLVGLDGIARLATTPYGGLLLAKLAMVAAMLALAAANRNRHTPAIESEIAGVAPDPANLARLRRSITLEAALGLTVLAAVAWFGTLQPIGVTIGHS